MTRQEYLDRAVTAIPVYRYLWEQAVLALPPLDPPGGVNVEVFYSASDLSKALGGARTVSNIRNELVWLQNWGWIKTRKGTSRRFLGRRTAGAYYLLADLAAHSATQEERLISRDVLGIKLDDLPVVTPESAARTGAGRKWQGDKNAPSGGTLRDVLGS